MRRNICNGERSKGKREDTYLSVAPVLGNGRIDLGWRGRGHAGHGHASCTARARR